MRKGHSTDGVYGHATEEETCTRTWPAHCLPMVVPYMGLPWQKKARVSGDQRSARTAAEPTCSPPDAHHVLAREQGGTADAEPGRGSARGSLIAAGCSAQGHGTRVQQSSTAGIFFLNTEFLLPFFPCKIKLVSLFIIILIRFPWNLCVSTSSFPDHLLCACMLSCTS